MQTDKTFSLQGFVDNYLELNSDNQISNCFRISDMGRCYRMRILKRMGASYDRVDERTMRLFEIGHVNHKFLQDLLDDAGILVSKEETVSIANGELVGHFDALIDFADGLHLLEFKNTHSRKLLYGDIDRHYIMQGLTYWLACEQKYPNIKDLRVCLISRDDWMIKEVGFTLTGEWRKDISNEIEQLLMYWHNRDKELPPLLPDTDWQCGYCNYRQHCPGKENMRKGGLNGLKSAKKVRETVV
jgi:hypothetical protein